MKILEYTGLDTSHVQTAYGKVIEAIARDDFRAAQVKKLANLSHGKFYRAKLDGAERDMLYDLFERCRAWLAECRLYELNLVAHEWQALAAPR